MQPAHAPPQQDPILSFSHMFLPKSTHVGGRCPPPREILDPPLPLVSTAGVAVFYFPAFYPTFFHFVEFTTLLEEDTL